MAAKHYVQVSDAVWAELVRVQKLTKVDKHDLVDDIIALAGDLEAIAEQHVDEPEPEPDPTPAVLVPTPSELAELI